MISTDAVYQRYHHQLLAPLQLTGASKPDRPPLIQFPRSIGWDGMWFVLLLEALRRLALMLTARCGASNCSRQFHCSIFNTRTWILLKSDPDVGFRLLAFDLLLAALWFWAVVGSFQMCSSFQTTTCKVFIAVAVVVVRSHRSSSCVQRITWLTL